MDSSQTPAENFAEKNDDTKPPKPVDVSKLENLVTAEQVLSASVARRRRNLRKPSNRTRELTPGRDAVEKSSTDEELLGRPKTPERRRRKSNRSVSRHREIIESLQPKNDEPVKPVDAVPNEPQIRAKRGSLVETTQAEILSFLDKAKRSIATRREKNKSKSESKKRSQSTPGSFTEKELLDSFERHKLLDGKDDGHRSFRKYSTGSSGIDSSADEPFNRKMYRPVVQQYLVKKTVQTRYSPKVVEILDPKSTIVVTAQEQPSKFRVIRFFKLIRSFTPFELYKEFQAFKASETEEYAKIRSLRAKCLSQLITMLIICGFGGVLFRFIEGTFENFYKCGVKRVKRDFIDTLWYRSHNLREDDWKTLARTKLRIFEEELHTAHEAGMHSYSGQRGWSFLNSVSYCLTVISTIGYGHMCPSTKTGMALTIVYAIIGIPLFLIVLTDFGKLFTRCIKFLWSFVRRVYYTGNCRQVRKTAHVQEIFRGAQMMYDIATFRRPSMFLNNPEEPTAGKASTVSTNTPTTPAPSNFEIDDEFNLPISLAIFILVLYIFIGAVLYSLWEGWDFFVSFYFVFISMSTIGFGDYVPKHPVWMIASIIYLVFGLALMSMCINVVQVKLSDTFKQASAKIGATIGLNVADEDGSIITVPPPEVELPRVHNLTVPTEAEMPRVHNPSIQVTPEEVS